MNSATKDGLSNILSVAPTLQSRLMRCIQGAHQNWLATGLLVLIVFLGLASRLDGLGDKTISHPEVYVPGIDLPEGISEPPPRFTLYQVLWWHFHDEPHPQGYYLAMWVWTKFFGTGLFALRLPSVLFGVGSIVLIYLFASFMYDRAVGLLSAGLLAFNGFHIFWSQHARMYAMGSFLGLVSTLLLLQLAYSSKKHPLREAAYVLVSALGCFTQEFFWPFLATQILWVVIHRSKFGSIFSRIVFSQTIAVIVASPLLAHAVYRARHPPVPGPSLAFLVEYLSFGFLFETDLFSDPPRSLPLVATLLLVLLAMLLLVRGLAATEHSIGSSVKIEAPNWRLLLPLVAGSLSVIFTMAGLAYRRRWLMALTGVVPILTLCMPSLLNHVSQFVMAELAKLKERLPVVSGMFSVCFLLAAVPFSTIFALSFWVPLLAGQAFLLFTPYLLVAIALGVKRLFRQRLIGIPLLILLVMIHGSSIAYFHKHPMEYLDYQGLAQKMTVKVAKEDLIFVRRRAWLISPIFYYLNSKKYRVIAEDFESAITIHPQSRVWVILEESQQVTENMREALRIFRIKEEIRALHIKALLYVRKEKLISDN